MKLTFQFLFFIIFYFPITALYSMELSTQKKYNFINVTEIRYQCYSLLKQLSQQPEMTHGNAYFGAQCQALPADYKYARIIEIICNAIKKNMDQKKAWSIEAVGCGINQVTLPNGHWMGDGLAKVLYENYQQTECSLETLKNKMRKTMNNIMLKWQPAIETLVSEMKLHTPVNNDQWIAFIKPQIIEEEHILFRFLSTLLNIRDYIHCDNTWKNNYDQKVIHLWIQKNSQKDVFQALKLQICENYSLTIS